LAPVLARWSITVNPNMITKAAFNGYMILCVEADRAPEQLQQPQQRQVEWVDSYARLIGRLKFRLGS
jgi:hypothetical protein